MVFLLKSLEAFSYKVNHISEGRWVNVSSVSWTLDSYS